MSGIALAHHHPLLPVFQQAGGENSFSSVGNRTVSSVSVRLPRQRRVGALVAWLACLGSLVCASPLAAQTSSAQEVAETVKETVVAKAQELESRMNQNKRVQELSAGLLQPIYDAAQFMAQPWFYAVAFGLMVAGLVSFAGQLVFTKFLLLFRLQLNFKEILGDALGLAISAIGLVLVTQAATQNSNFTESPALVVVTAVVGAIAGFFFYLWGQGTEFQAARRGTSAPAPRPVDKPKM